MTKTVATTGFESEELLQLIELRDTIQIYIDHGRKTKKGYTKLEHQTLTEWQASLDNAIDCLSDTRDTLEGMASALNSRALDDAIDDISDILGEEDDNECNCGECMPKPWSTPADLHREIEENSHGYPGSYPTVAEQLKIEEDIRNMPSFPFVGWNQASPTQRVHEKHFGVNPRVAVTDTEFANRVFEEIRVFMREKLMTIPLADGEKVHAELDLGVVESEFSGE